MKCISFIGKGNYSETTYVYEDFKKTTKFIQEALCEFFHPDEIILFVTEKAKENLQEILPNLKVKNHKIVEIPDGHNEKEFWDIFDKICDSVRDRDEILFDLTHGFRSIPFVAFLSIAYLKEIKNITVKKVVYGAFDARKDNETPLLDLTQFTTVLDWMMGVREFVKYGAGKTLSGLLRGSHDRAYKENFYFKPKRLKPFADRIEEFSNSISLSRSIEAINKAGIIGREIKTVEEEIANLNLKPVIQVFEWIRRITDMAYDGDKLDEESLLVQFKLVEYQIETGLVLQAVELLREWVVNYLILNLGYKKEEWLKREVREVVETTLNGLKRKRDGEVYTPTGLMDKFEKMSQCEDIIKFWGEITNLRNDLAHCGMNPKRIPSNKIVKKAEDLIEKANKLFRMNM